MLPVLLFTTFGLMDPWHDPRALSLIVDVAWITVAVMAFIVAFCWGASVCFREKSGRSSLVVDEAGPLAAV